jgi:hypothetical protein
MTKNCDSMGTCREVVATIIHGNQPPSEDFVALTGSEMVSVARNAKGVSRTPLHEMVSRRQAAPLAPKIVASAI